MHQPIAKNNKSVLHPLFERKMINKKIEAKKKEKMMGQQVEINARKIK